MAEASGEIDLLPPRARFGAAARIALASAIAAAAIASRSLATLAVLLAVVLVGYALARADARELWRDARWLVAQGAVVVAATLALRGPGALAAGVRTALQLALCFLPFALVVRTTASEDLLRSLSRALPERLAFGASVALRFVPILAREASELAEAQRLRGARLAIADAWRPRAWSDWLHCVAVPMTVRAIEAAGELADAADIRGLGAREREDRSSASMQARAPATEERIS